MDHHLRATQDLRRTGDGELEQPPEDRTGWCCSVVSKLAHLNHGGQSGSFPLFGEDLRRTGQ